MSTQQFYKSGSIWIHLPDPYFFSSKQIISYLLKYIFNIKKVGLFICSVWIRICKQFESRIRICKQFESRIRICKQFESRIRMCNKTFQNPLIITIENQRRRTVLLLLQLLVVIILLLSPHSTESLLRNWLEAHAQRLLYTVCNVLHQINFLLLNNSHSINMILPFEIH